MSIIHMDVESTKSAADRIVGVIDGLDNVQQRLEGAANAIESGWSSDKAEGYRSRIRAAGKAITAAVNGLAALGMQMQNEITQWLEMDGQRAQGMQGNLAYKYSVASQGAFVLQTPRGPVVFEPFTEEEILAGNTALVQEQLAALKNTDMGRELDAMARKAGIRICYGNTCLGDPNGKVVYIELGKTGISYGDSVAPASHGMVDGIEKIIIDPSNMPNPAIVDEGYNASLRSMLGHEISHAIDQNSGMVDNRWPSINTFMNDREKYDLQLEQAIRSQLNTEVRAYEVSNKLGSGYSGISPDGTISESERAYVFDDLNYRDYYTEIANKNLPYPSGVSIGFDPQNGEVIVSDCVFLELSPPGPDGSRSLQIPPQQTGWSIEF